MRSTMKFDFKHGTTQKGVGLIEVLIAVLVLSVGMLGLAAMQAMALKNNQSSMQRSQGVMYAYSILDAMRSDVSTARAGGYNLARSCAVPSGGTLVTNAQHDWISNLKNGIGASACGTINCAGDLCLITVDWNDEKAKAGLQKQEFKTEARL